MFKKYSELVFDKVTSDFHIHSNWSDGEGSIKNIIAEAEKKGLTEIAITDHIRKDSTYFDEFLSEIKFLRQSTKIKLYAGFEAKIENFKGEIDVSEDVLRKSDLSIASVHRFPIGRKLIAARHFPQDLSEDIELELSIAAIKRGGFSILGHPGGMSIRAYGKFKKEYFEEIISELCKTNIAFDFNYAYHKYLVEDLIPIFKKYDPFISIGSDAHKLLDIGNGKKLF